MRKIGYYLSIALFLLTTYGLQRSWKAGEAQLPPPGSFFSPFTGFWQNADPVDQKGTRSLKIESLDGKADLIWDERGVPHIYAASYKDAIFLQGYAHARDRLWQMDFATRAAAGRVSEILGPIALEFDREKRRRGMLEAAKQTEIAWRQFTETYDLLEAYADGVNAYISSLSPADLPIEYKLMQFEPEPWTPLKTSLFFKNMALVLCSRNQDLGLTNARGIFGDSLFQALYPEEQPDASPIIPANISWDSSLIGMPLEINKGIENILFGKGRMDTVPAMSGIGSNNWAVAPFKTRDGHAILCNDPHLPLTLPSVWYECHLVCPETNSYGASFPGAPGVIIGFNENSAWGFTNTGIDVVEWYAMDWQDEARTKYRIASETYNVTYRLDTILVKGQEPYIDSVKITRYGPVYTENPASPYAGLASHWIATETPETDELGTFIGLNRGKSLEDYRQSIRGFNSPAQNMIYADTSGNIALTVQGKFPIKSDQQGRFILDGSKDGQEWRGFVPEEYQPFVVNPERGYVSSANQKPTAANYPYYYSSGDFREYRGKTVNTKLDTMKDITPEKMMALQLDNESFHARKLLPVLISRLDRSALDEAQTTCLDKLEGWNYRYDRDMDVPILFELWRDSFVHIALDEIHQRIPTLEVKYPEDWVLADLLERDPENQLWDIRSTPTLESAESIVLESFKKACAKYSDLNKADDDLDWGRFQGTVIGHIARIEAFSSDKLYTSGAAEALNATRRSEGPSWRMVVELGPEIRAWGVYPGGQSGNPGNKHYDQMVEAWTEGQYFQLKHNRDPEALSGSAITHLKINQ